MPNYLWLTNANLNLSCLYTPGREFELKWAPMLSFNKTKLLFLRSNAYKELTCK